MYAIVDIETTGGHASSNGITEIAIFVHDGNRVTGKFHTLVNPGRNVPLYITALTGISNEMLADAPLFDEIAADVWAFLENNIFVAHNVNFDYSFLKHQLKHSGYNLDVKKLCTVRLGRKVFPGLPSYSLGNLCRSLGISISNRHRASGDAAATVTLFEKLLEHDTNGYVQTMLKKHSGDQWLPLQLDKSAIDALPTCTGVYYFHDRKSRIIYVGKAVNIRKRVSSHFTHNDAEKKRQHFLRHVASITYQSCITELEALVLESAEIKRLWPKYNYSQKQPERKFALYSFEDGRGYMRLAIDKRKKNLPALYQFNLLHEGLVMLNRMIDEFGLNPKLCFTDKSRITTEDLSFMDPPHIYNGKVKVALENLEAALPSFAIMEKRLSDNGQLCLLIDRGQFYGMGYLPEGKSYNNINDIREAIQPLADNDFIRNSVYAYAEAYPEKVERFSRR